MNPAFSSTRQAVGFALLLAFLLALPALLSGNNWGDRRELYASIPNTYGPYPWIERKIFKETNDVDIAFLGSSHLWYGVDTPYVQHKLSEQLHREAEVFTMGWVWAGYDVLYNIARDLLSHRRVHTLVINDEYANRDVYNFHASSRYWYRVGERPELVASLPWAARLRLYAIAVTGMPRQLLNFLRTNPKANPEFHSVNVRDADRTFWRMEDPATQLGAACCRGRMDGPGAVIDSTRFHPKLGATPEDVVVDADQKSPAFSFSGVAVPPLQVHFARMLAQLCRQQGTRLVVLHLPALSEAKQATIPERALVVEALDAPLVGIPGVILFSNIPGADLPNLYVDPTHLNHNGRELFTQLIAPALLSLNAKPNVP